MRVVLLAGRGPGRGRSEDFSLQELTSQEPAWATATEGVVKLVVAVVVPAVLAEAVTAEVPPLLR